MAGNPYTVHKRLDALEQVAREALQSAKNAHQRLDVAPPRGEQGLTGPPGTAGKDAISIPGKDGRDAVGLPGSNGSNGTNGRDGAPGPDSAAVLAEAR